MEPEDLPEYRIMGVDPAHDGADAFAYSVFSRQAGKATALTATMVRASLAQRGKEFEERQRQQAYEENMAFMQQMMNLPEEAQQQFYKGTIGLLDIGAVQSQMLELTARANEEIRKMMTIDPQVIAAPARVKVTMDSIWDVYRLLRDKLGLQAKNIAITITGEDFDAIVRANDDLNMKLVNPSMMQFYGIELLYGGSCPGLPQVHTTGLSYANAETARREILSCLGRGKPGELPDGPGGDRVRAAAERVGKAVAAMSPAGGNNGNSRRLCDLSYEEKVVAAKEAVAAYTRDKKLPSAEMLALYRELDGLSARNKLAATEAAHADSPVGRERALYSRAIGYRTWEGADVEACPIAAEAWLAGCRDINDIDRYRHGLSSEALGRAVNKVGGFERGGPQRDFIGAAAQSFAEMLD